MNAANFLINCLKSHFGNQAFILKQVKKHGPVIANGNLSGAFSQIIHLVPEWFLDHGLRKYRPVRIKAIKKINRPETLKQQVARRKQEQAIQHDLSKAIKEEYRAARRKVMEDSRNTHSAAVAKAREEAKARKEALKLAKEAAGRAIETKLAARHKVERQESKEAARNAARKAIKIKVAAIKTAEQEKKEKQRTWSDVFWDALDDFNPG